MTLRTVRLELARSREFPDGSPARGYEFVAPLDADGHLDAGEWRREKARCTVRRFWQGEPDERGVLAHVGSGWRFDYDRHRSDDDEPLFKLDRHTIKEGEYLSVTEHDGAQRTFRVVSIR
ncbi:MAG: hypothetical protein FJX65_15360 [Alphaproteobacteria bacterium]|nr:hypothetical protein [Alphaproteobacteria bacterium]